jgi:hypothetical protein
MIRCMAGVLAILCFHFGKILISNKLMELGASEMSEVLEIPLLLYSLSNGLRNVTAALIFRDVKDSLVKSISHMEKGNQ